MKKLLSKPFKAFTIYALIILLCSIPVYYWVVDRIWLHELDDHNNIVKGMVEKGLTKTEMQHKELDDILKLWNIVQPGTTLTPVNTPAKEDSFYTVTRSMNGEVDRFRGLASYIAVHDKTYLLTVETNVEEADETIAAISIVTFVFFSLLVTGFILLNKRISKNIWKPFSDTLGKLKSFDLAKDPKLNFGKTDIEEFQQLNDTLDKLIQQNISVYNQQKVFIENASHELQTPLAVLKSKMDILLQNKDITTEQLQILEAIEMPISRMSRINKNLLLLAKIENSQFAEKTAINLPATLDSSIKLLADYIQDKNLRLSNEAKEPLEVSCNSFLLETMINNLLTNSIRHTAPGGIITIELKDKILTFKNSGTSALNEATLFERFGISSKETVNSGLGLAIIKEICNRYGWRISYLFANNFHSFSVSFP